MTIRKEALVKRWVEAYSETFPSKTKPSQIFVNQI